MNGYIRAPEVRVVAPDGEQIGVKKLAEALWLAEQLDMDLVEVAPTAKPPVCKIMDYGKFKYEQSVREREARKNQTRTVIKETRLTPRIAEHDFDMQARRTAEWLSEGDKVKVTVRFRGRERERPEYGERVLRRLFETVEDMAQIEQSPSLEGRQMVMTLAPLRNRPKADSTSSPAEKVTDPGPVATATPAPKPEVTEPEVTEPEVTEPEVTEPEVTEPEVTEPEVTDESSATDTRK